MFYSEDFKECAKKNEEELWNNKKPPKLIDGLI